MIRNSIHKLHPARLQFSHRLVNVVAIKRNIVCAGRWAFHWIRGVTAHFGFRQIKGFRQEDAEKLMMRRDCGYDGMRHLALQSALPPDALSRLAEADAFRSLGLVALLGFGLLASSGCNQATYDPNLSYPVRSDFVVSAVQPWTAVPTTDDRLADLERLGVRGRAHRQAA